MENGDFKAINDNIGKILDRQIQVINTKYENLFESKLKEFENRLKIEEKSIKNEKKKEEIKEKIEEVNIEKQETKRKRGRPKKQETINNEENKNTSDYNNIVTIFGMEENEEPSNVYKEIQNVEVKEAAENIDTFEKRTNLQDMINRLKFRKN